MNGRLFLYGGAAIALALILALSAVPGPPPPPPDFQSFEIMMKFALLADDLPGARSILEEHRSHFEGQLKFELLQGWLFEKEGDVVGAVTAYRHGLALATGDQQRHEILCSLGDLERRRDDSEAGWRCLREAEDLTGRSLRSGELRVLLLLSDGRRNEALSEARHLADENPDSERARRLVASLEARDAAETADPPQKRSGALEAR